MSNNKKTQGVLCKEEIKTYGLIADGFDEDCLQTCSYDLRLSDRHYTFDGEGKLSAVFLGTDGKQLDLANTDIKDEELKLHFSAGQPDILRIPPFGSAIIELKEVVDTYSVAKNQNRLVVGRFDLKLKSIYKGLISQQATQVEPCYRGRLYCFLHNFTAKEIIFKKDERVATIEFLYAGGEIDEKTTKQIVNETVKENEKKYTGKFVYEGQGICDVRFLPNRGSIPVECGLAPIYRMVNNNVDAAVQRYMEKDSTVNFYSERIGKRIDEHQGVVKLVLSLAVGVVSLLGVSFVTDVLTQLRYFEEQLTFFGQTISDGETIGPEVLASLEAHARSFDAFRGELFCYTIIAIVAIVTIILLYYYFVSESYWIKRRNRLAGRNEYEKLKKETDDAKEKEAKEKEAENGSQHGTQNAKNGSRNNKGKRTKRSKK